MNNNTKCEKCGTELRDDTASGLCPRCLMALSLESRTMPDGERPDLKVPLSAEEMQERFPQFEILEFLGRGGMGVVYKARQIALDRMVAIKVLPGERQGDVDFARRFEREAKILAQMNHPNIVTIFDFGEADGLYYIVMEYVDGVNLRDLLQDGKMDPRQALAVVPPVCEALEYAHEKGVVHRDIKPENLLLDREGRVKIADFGIASLLGASAEKSGTPPYMAPEQEQGAVDRRVDIYALGAVLYEMLTGERPGKPIEPPSKKILVDVRLDEVVLRALDKEPERRYKTAGEFRTVVQTIATTLPATQSASGRPPPEDAAALPRLFRMAIVVAGVGALLILGDIANFHFLLGVGKTPLLMTGAIILAAALVGLLLPNSRGITEGQSALIHTPMLRAPRFSRTAIVGAVWAVFSISAILSVFAAVMPFTKVLVLLGLTGAFGTTILGCVALSRIRRSAGQLRGLGLALFDALLFPLLKLAGLVGSFFVRRLFGLNAAELASDHHQLSGLARIYIAHATGISVLATAVVAVPVCFLIIRWARRAVRQPIGDQSSGGTSLPTSASAWGIRTKLGLIIGLSLAMTGALIGPRLLKDYLVHRAGAAIPVDMAREAITPHLKAASLRWRAMTFEPNTASPSDVIVRFEGLERHSKTNDAQAWTPVDGLLNLRTLDGVLWRATGLKELRGLLFSFELGPTFRSNSARRDQPDQPRAVVKACFGPVIERTVNFTGTNCLLDLDHGNFVGMPADVAAKGSQAAIAWVSRSGIDVGGGSQPTLSGLIGFDLIASPTDNKTFDSTSADMLVRGWRDIFAMSKPGNPVYLTAKGGFPTTFAFKTREGGMGVLQIVEVQPNEYTSVRYKMMLDTPPQAKPVATEGCPVTLEFRPAESAPGEGLTEMTVAGSGAKVYLRDEVVLSNADVASASVVTDGPGGPRVRIVFTKAGGKRFTQATEDNIMKPIAILVDGNVVTAPIVREKITARNAEISGSLTVEEARRIAEGIVPR